jgi:hypothetical protein
LPGEIVSAKFGAVTVNPIVVELLSAPELPIIVMVYVPGAAVLLALRLRLLVLAVLDGLN